ncbi:MAG: alkaline phosphatase D family protein [Myxococcota bacterium]
MLGSPRLRWILALAWVLGAGCDGSDGARGDESADAAVDAPRGYPDTADARPRDGAEGDTPVPSGDTDADTLADVLPDSEVLDGTDAQPVDLAPDSSEATDAVPDGDASEADAGVDAADVADAVVDVGPPPPTFHPADHEEDLGAFPLAVQAGDARPDGARLWTRHAGDAPLRLLVFGDGSPISDGPVHLDQPVARGEGGFVQVDVTGLEPGTWYRYAFLVEEADGAHGARSAVGRFRTAFGEDAQPPVVFGATSCIDKGIHPFAPLEQAAFDDLDFMVMAGDTVYADGAETLGDYRDVWHEWYAEAEFRKLHASTSFLYTWDDHETVNNWDPETIDPAQAAAARQAFFDFGAIRSDAPDEQRIWRSVRWGRTLEVFVLDCRSERKPSTRSTADAQYISPEQMAWLKQGLVASDATFKVIVNSVPFTDMPPVVLSTGDRWEGYSAQREEVLEVLHDVSGVLWVSGDFHFGAVGGIEPPGEPLAEVREVLAGPAAKLPNPLWAVVANGQYADQFQFLTGVNNYVRFIAEPQADPPTITVEFVDGSGDVLHSQELWF